MVGLCMDIETWLKGASAEQGASPLEAVRRFLGEQDEQLVN